MSIFSEKTKRDISAEAEAELAKKRKAQTAREQKIRICAQRAFDLFIKEVEKRAPKAFKEAKMAGKKSFSVKILICTLFPESIYDKGYSYIESETLYGEELRIHLGSQLFDYPQDLTIIGERFVELLDNWLIEKDVDCTLKCSRRTFNFNDMVFIFTDNI